MRATRFLRCETRLNAPACALARAILSPDFCLLTPVPLPYHGNLKTWVIIAAITVGFALAICGTFLFAVRAGRAARRMHAADEPVRAWMSIPFIAHSHHVPESLLFDAIGVEPRRPRDRRSVRHIARDTNRPVPQLIAQLQRAVDSAAPHSAPHEPPSGPSR